MFSAPCLSSIFWEFQLLLYWKVKNYSMYYWWSCFSSFFKILEIEKHNTGNEKKITRIFTISFIVSILIDIYSHLAIFIYYLNIPSFDYLNLFIIHVLKSFLLNSKSVPTQSFYRWLFFWWGGWSFVYYIFCLNIKHCRQYQVATLDSVLSFRGLLVLFHLLCFNNQLTCLDSTAK